MAISNLLVENNYDLKAGSYESDGRLSSGNKSGLTHLANMQGASAVGSVVSLVKGEDSGGDDRNRYSWVLDGQETGGDAGSNLRLNYYQDDGTDNGPCIAVTRSSGVVEFPKGARGPHVGPSANTGGAYVTDDADRTLTGDEVVGGVAFNCALGANRVITLPSASDLITALGFTPSAGTQLPPIIVRESANTNSFSFTVGADGTRLGNPTVQNKSVTARIYFTSATTYNLDVVG